MCSTVFIVYLPLATRIDRRSLRESRRVHSTTVEESVDLIPRCRKCGGGLKPREVEMRSSPSESGGTGLKGVRDVTDQRIRGGRVGGVSTFSPLEGFYVWISIGRGEGRGLTDSYTRF